MYAKTVLTKFAFNSNQSRLILSSFLLLFVELTLIRWIGSHLYFLFFFSNMVLLASFLGMGISFLRQTPRLALFPYSALLLGMLILCVYYFSYNYQAKLNPITDNLDYSDTLFKNHLYPVEITLPLIFAAVTLVMTSIADGVAFYFAKFPVLIAYRLEILGSLLGIITFSFLSYFNASPLYWGVVITFLYITLTYQFITLKTVFRFFIICSGLLLLLATFTKESLTPHHYWSAYYKINVQPYTGNRYAVNVNGLTQQVIESVEQRQRVKPFYLKPYLHKRTPALNHVLVIGAGTGGDVAIALSQGAKQVDAVEIDPAIYRLGKLLNPNRPYQDARVHVFINDGRAFLEQHRTTKYDMIIFALTDSLALIPGQSSLRLENYLYTLEGITAAKNHLTSDGIFVIYNYYRYPWFIDRLSRTLAQVFQHPPCIDTYGMQDYWATVLTISLSPSALSCSHRWTPTHTLTSLPATDDHPFLYLALPQLSFSQLVTGLFVLLVALITCRMRGVAVKGIAAYSDLFFMGTAFLLLETKNIVTFALLFGTTWFVNALVFIGILFIVYLAIEITERNIQFKPFILYISLIISLLVAWLVPNEYLLALALLPRFLLATLLAFLPILIANLIFAERLQHTKYSTQAFGANLIGAVFGGLLEYLAIAVGYQWLIVLIAGLYTAAMLFNRKAIGPT